MQNRLFWLTALFAAEVLAIVLVFQVFSSVECRLTDVENACRALRSVMVRSMCAFAATGLFLWFRPVLRQKLVAASQNDYGARLWAIVHLAGLGLIFLPWITADAAQLNANFRTYLYTLIGGATLAGLGGLLWLLPHHHLMQWLRDGGAALLPVALAALFIPDLALALDPLWWSVRGLLVATFYGVAVILALLGNHVLLDPDSSSIGTGGFIVDIAGSCSGIEGFALTTGFLAIYAVLMRDTLKQRRFWLIVFPVALLVSWLFNLIRISILILIGAHVSPELAVNGFHSFAGWLFFTILALAVLWVVQVVPGLHRTEPVETDEEDLEVPPLSQDLAAAQIAPFLVFMVSGLLVNTFWQEPAVAYPLQAAMIAAALWVFHKPILSLEWRMDPVAVAAGVLVGLGWIITAQSGETVAGLGDMGAGALAGWVVIRVIGTSALVPVVEELFFRGYLLNFLKGETIIRTGAAVVISSLGFALLHGRIVEAGVAGVIFALVVLRQGRVADAIVAHAVANAIIAIAAMIGGDWSLI